MAGRLQAARRDTRRRRAGATIAAVLLGGCAGCSTPTAGPSAEPSAAEDVSPGAVSSRDALLSVEPWTFEQIEGRTLRTRHYRVFTTETSEAILGRIPGFLEDALAHYRSALGPLPPPPQRLDTYLMDNRPQWRRVTLRLLGAAGRDYERIQRGGFASRGVAVLYDIGLFDTLAIAAHEGWHQYTQRTFRDPLPVWLEEGIASYMEGHRWDHDAPLFLPWANIERFDQLRTAHAAGQLLPLDELLRVTPQSELARPGDAALNYYAQVWALTHFLNEGADGRHRADLRTLLADASAGRMRRVLALKFGDRAARRALVGRNGPAIFLTYFTDQISASAAEYDAFLEALVRPGARDAIVAGRSPFSSRSR